tara:strand:- start:141 stop:611 length:471 start_codon:yes stop_codon:yes gene_type:complete
MIINCPNCKKQFNVDSNLIPDIGKLLKCGSCNHTWFFNKYNEVNDEKEIISEKKFSESKKTLEKSFKKKKVKTNISLSNLPKNKGSELVKYEPKFNFGIGNVLNYTIVFIISFVAVIILLDTFEKPLSAFFPNIELILYNFFETLKDLKLFIKDLK